MPAHLRFVPGMARPVFAGEGHVGRVEIVNAGSEPLSVNVENLDEVSGPLGDIARIMQQGLEHLRRPTQTEGPAREEGSRRGPEGEPTGGQGLDGVSAGAWALAVLKEHPDWTVGQIAEAVGVHRSTVYRSDDFEAVRTFLAMREHGRRTVPRGRKDADTGELEAWNDDESEDEAR